MIVVTLKRTQHTSSGTFGKVDCLGVEFDSGELPWENNAPDISCIPEGSYRAVWAFSPRFQRYTYLLKDVPGRDAIRIHAANFMGDKKLKMRCQLDGCLALGSGIVWFDKQQMLTNSSASVSLFENRLKGEPFELQISSAFSRPTLV